MTDAEACIWLKFRYREATDRLVAGDVTAENDLAAFDHVLQAMTDRTALVEALEHHARASACGEWPQARDARCHMQGRE